MSLVTLHSGRVVDVTPENLADVTNEQIAAYKASGFTDVELSGLGAAIHEALSQAAGVSYDTSARQASQDAAARVLANPFVQAADVVSNAKGLTHFAIPGGPSWLADLLARFQQIGETIKIVAIVGGAVVVVGGAAFLVWRFRK